METRVIRILWEEGQEPVWEANDGPWEFWKGGPKPVWYEVWKSYCLTELLR